MNQVASCRPLLRGPQRVDNNHIRNIMFSRIALRLALLLVPLLLACGARCAGADTAKASSGASSGHAAPKWSTRLRTGDVVTGDNHHG